MDRSPSHAISAFGSLEQRVDILSQANYGIRPHAFVSLSVEVSWSHRDCTSAGAQRVTVIDYPDGRLAIRPNGVDLPYRTFDKRPQVNQTAIVENKRLGPVLASIAEKQKELDMSRSAKAPRRRGQKNHMFKIG